MGRMKDKLGENPPTIGDCRREGMTTLSVHCGAPCGRVSKVTFDALRPPDETIFIAIPKKCRLRCTSCRWQATEISANWNEVLLYGTGKRPIWDWVVIRKTPEGIETRSSALASQERAMGLAFDLADGGDAVLRLEGPSGDVAGEGVEAARGEEGLVRNDTRMNGAKEFHTRYRHGP